MNYDEIIEYYYGKTADVGLINILLVHSRCVAELAKEICLKHKELDADVNFVYAAAMLHDIGIIKCDAPGIKCFGTQPYIRHGVEGAEMLRQLNVSESFARVCERHTGTGLTAKAIEENNFPLPIKDLVPETVEEKIICYADKFFSKTRLDERKTYEQALSSLRKFGEDGIRLFSDWHEIFA